jgi:molybdate transport repressor ModE-like protein
MDEIARQPEARRTLNRVRMRQVALMLAIQDLGTLTAAAAELGMTQPAATKMLRELEAAMEHRLFERVGRHLVVTPAGHKVLLHFNAIRGTLVAMNRDLASLSSAGESLSIGSIMAPSPTLLSKAIVATRQALPALSVHITIDTSDRLLERLDRGEVDIVIGRLSDGFSRREYRMDLLEEEALAVVVSARHRLARKRTVRLEELAAMAWVLQPKGSPIRELLEREFRLANIDMPTGLVETAAIFTTANLVEDSDHVAVLPLSVAKPFAKHGMLAILPVAMRGQMEPYGTIVRRGRPLSAGARHFLSTIHKAVGIELPN